MALAKKKKSKQSEEDIVGQTKQGSRVDAIPAQTKANWEGLQCNSEFPHIHDRWNGAHIMWPVTWRHIQVAPPLLSPSISMVLHTLLSIEWDACAGLMAHRVEVPSECTGGPGSNGPIFLQLIAVVRMRVISLARLRWDPSNCNTAHLMLPAQPGSWAFIEPGLPTVE